jgi:hypothetical protein
MLSLPLWDITLRGRKSSEKTGQTWDNRGCFSVSTRGIKTFGAPVEDVLPVIEILAKKKCQM